MSAEDWKNSITKNPGTHRTCKVERYVQEHAIDRRSPIDLFYDASGNITRFATKQGLAQSSDLDFLGPLLLVGLVSSTENYYRELFSRVLSVCPISRKHAADQTIPLGAVAWHPEARQARGAFESLSFASSKELQSNSKKFLAFDCVGPLARPLGEYDSICNLRHAIVHANAELPGRNAVKLGVRSAKHGHTTTVRIGLAELQEAWDICMVLVCTFNRELFEKIAHRWAREWRTLPSWVPENEHKVFAEIWRIFHSEADHNANRLSGISLIRCRNLIRRET